MKRWLRMSGVQIAKTVSSFSLVLLAVLAMGGTYRDLSAKIAPLKDGEAVAKIVSEEIGKLSIDESLQNAIRNVEDSPDSTSSVLRLKQLIELHAQAESDNAPPASGQVKEIKSSGLYRDPGIQDQSNWLEGALRHLADLIPKNKPRVKAPTAGSQMGGFVDLIVPLMWGLLAVAVLVFGYFAIRHFQWRIALRRKARAVLEDDEPERTLDEWLAMANQFAGEGKYREAVRAMYLSCLLKFDEAGVARFIRGETNWEHLARIQASAKKPADLDFLPPTRAFDRIWYGFHVRGQEDVDQFKVWYEQITEILRGARR